jgi:hypothetical protein
MSATTFIRDHTAQDDTLPQQDECPICLETYTTEQCLRITNIPSCTHNIGADCLDRLLRSNAHEEKKCPLCRTTWIPARALPFPPRNESLGTSRRMAYMFAGLDGIGADIGGGQQVGAPARLPSLSPPVFTPPPQQDANERVSAWLREPSPSRAPNRRSPIVIDSDSDEAGYETQFMHFENLRRDIADIRRRAQDTQLSRGSRKRRVAERENGRGAANEGAQNTGNTNTNTTPTDLNRANTAAGGGRGEDSSTPGTRALSRFLNTRARNPFRTAENPVAAVHSVPASGPSAQCDEQRDSYRARERRRGTQLEQLVQRTADNASGGRASTPHRPLPSPGLPEASVDVDMTAEEVVELPVIQSRQAREAVRSRQLDHREAELNRREQALAARQVILTRHEAAAQERKRSTNEILLVVRRQRRELEELVRRHGDEIDGILNG